MFAVTWTFARAHTSLSKPARKSFSIPTCRIFCCSSPLALATTSCFLLNFDSSSGSRDLRRRARSRSSPSPLPSPDTASSGIQRSEAEFSLPAAVTQSIAHFSLPVQRGEVSGGPEVAKSFHRCPYSAIAASFAWTCCLCPRKPFVWALRGARTRRVHAQGEEKERNGWGK